MKPLIFVLCATLALAAFPAWSEEDTIEEVEEVSEVSESPKAKKDRFHNLEFSPILGRGVFSNTTELKDAFTGGFHLAYYLKGEIKAPDGLTYRLQGRHGFSLDYYYTQTEYYEQTTLGKKGSISFITLDGVSLTRGGGQITNLTLRDQSDINTHTVMLSYIYSAVDQKGRRRKWSSYFPMGIGYISFPEKVKQSRDDDIGDQTFKIPDSIVYSLGLGLRYQLSSRRTISLEVRDMVWESEDRFYRGEGLLGTDYTFNQDSTYNHNFFITFSMNFMFN